ncbi:hypothetical protein [Sphingobium sp. EM0848]|uniref:hypothetical protein n=1 Tax=Sphingobium sp. EM0848 TaxID=2743473 RepID=UPI00159C8BA9|nr:hypothetical protein [Sphingobium sp. EM0848]
MTQNSIGADAHRENPLSTIRAQLERAAAEAQRGCGLSYDLYVRRFNAAAEPILNAVDPDLRSEAAAIAAALGYGDDEADADYGPGICSLTGIDEYCCPCGRHP